MVSETIFNREVNSTLPAFRSAFVGKLSEAKDLLSFFAFLWLYPAMEEKSECREHCVLPQLHINQLGQEVVAQIYKRMRIGGDSVKVSPEEFARFLKGSLPGKYHQAKEVWKFRF